MAGRIRRWLPLLALSAGIFLFGLSLVVIGIEAAEADPEPLEPSAFTSANGTAMLAYPTKYFGYESQRVEVAYTFPVALGDALVVDCEGYGALLRGERVTPLLAFTGLKEGAFVVSFQTLPTGAHYDIVVDPQTGARTFCEPVVVFAWQIAGEDATSNRPTASVTLHTTPFDQGRGWVLLVLLTASSVLALLGGLAWAQRRSPGATPASDATVVEVLRASLDGMGEQLQRTRRHLQFAGVLGIFLWYPVLVPWAWREAAETDVNAVFPWAIAGLTLIFLIVLTGLWVRELHRLDCEILSWRSRMVELREREVGLLQTLEQGR
jgi:hypothetical protein